MAITDEESAAAWLKDKPESLRNAFGARCALRSAPGILYYLRQSPTPSTALGFFRAVLSTGVLAKYDATGSEKKAQKSRSYEARKVMKSAAFHRVNDWPASVATNWVVENNQALFVDKKKQSDEEQQSALRAMKKLTDSALNNDAVFVEKHAADPTLVDKLFGLPLWPAENGSFELTAEPEGLAKAYEELQGHFQMNRSVWDFWYRWLEGMRTGQPMDWALQEQVALIDDAVWQKGPKAVAKAIREIEETRRKAQNAATAPPSTREKEVVGSRMSTNRDALAVSASSLLEQLGEFRESVRGMNSLEPEFRDEVLDFIDKFSGELRQLLDLLPVPGEDVTEAQAERGAIWLRQYWGVVKTKVAFYASPENAGEATVPTAIVLASTGVGAMLGQPLAGSVVGCLIANQMKPGQAAKELTKPKPPDLESS